ncbi:DJC24 protein, partial [Amia calva]|nr:DJC24 protein [Amia calva]
MLSVQVVTSGFYRQILSDSCGLINLAAVSCVSVLVAVFFFFPFFYFASYHPSPVTLSHLRTNKSDLKRFLFIYFFLYLCFTLSPPLDWQYHPDKQSPDVPPGEVEQRVQRFIEVDQAWKILGNEETKREYDLQRRATELQQRWPVDAQVFLEDMNWVDGEQAYMYECRCGGEYILSKEDAEEHVSIICCDTCSLSIEVNKCSF